MLPFDRHLQVIAEAAGRMVAVADLVPLDTPTVTAPDWDLRALLHHQGEVHRFASAVLANQATSFDEIPDDYLGDLPDDAQLVDWFRRGVTVLTDTLRTADTDTDYVTFHRHVPGSRRDWWARRQAHETTVHAMDAASAVGPIPSVEPEVAADGLDEFLSGFLPRPRTPLHRERPARLRIVAADVGQAWTVTVSDAMPVTVRSDDDAGDVDALVIGSSVDLYPCLWNRSDLTGIRVEGDPTLFADLRDHVRIRWS